MLMTCGGAVVAGMLAFSLHQIGKQVPVYDVSGSQCSGGGGGAVRLWLFTSTVLNTYRYRK